MHEGDPDYAHIVDLSRFNLTAAYIEGTPVEALCGYRWVPSRDPERLPLCPKCKKIKDGLVAARSGSN